MYSLNLKFMIYKSYINKNLYKNIHSNNVYNIKKFENNTISINGRTQSPG